MMGISPAWHQLKMRLHPLSIRDRLLVALLLMVLIPAVAFGAISGLVGFQRGREQVIDKLSSVAVLKEDEIKSWAENAKTDLITVMLGDEVQQWMVALLSRPVDQVEDDAAYQKLLSRFDVFVEQTKRFEELYLLNLRGIILVSTDRQRKGGIGARTIQAFTSSGGEGSYLNPPSFNLAALTDESVGIVVVRPIYGDGKLLGVLAGRASSARLNEIMLERTGLGETGETFLVASNQVMLTEPRFPANGKYSGNYVFSEAATASVRYHNNGSGIYVNHRVERVVGVYRWLPDLQVALMAEQSEKEAMAAVRQTLAINVGVAIAALLLAVGVSLVLAQSIASPLSDLAQTAGRISEGHLDLFVPVIRGDEIGALARAFNDMTARLREFIDNLDQQVKERTQTLRQRAVQLETNAQVGREITSILDLEELLDRVVNLIAKAFGYYHVAIYLVDPESNKLVFRTGAGEVGRPGLAQFGPLELGPGSLNGEAAAGNETIVVADVTQDSRYFADDRLEETRSELVVPLRIGERVIGTLDVQSSQVMAFNEDDARLIQGLGDQVAVSIENARLYEQSRVLAVVEERSRLARELHDSVTQCLYAVTLYSDATVRLLELGEQNMAIENVHKISSTTREALGEMRLLIFELRPQVLQEEGLVGALETRLDAVERRVGLQTAIHVHGNARLNLEVEEGLYRIAVEALNNVVKHARAHSVAIWLDLNSKTIAMEVVDDGVGFDLADKSGMGLRGMAERAGQLGGRFVVDSKPGAGTKARVEFDA